MAHVQLNRVCKVHPGGVHAVRDFSLDVPRGAMVVVVGPSGCGKSTLLRLIAGLQAPTSGTIAIAGRQMARVPPGERDSALVFQSSALYPHMTARDNLRFPLRQRSRNGGLWRSLFRRAAWKAERTEIDRRVEETARTLGILPSLDRLPRALSGGERQRVALGRALVRSPGLLLLDEPLSNVDGPLRAELRTEMKLIQRTTGITTIHVTHDQDEAMALADTLVVMRAGGVEQAGSPLECYAAPATRFVASFLGSPQMSFVEGTLRGGLFTAQGLSLPVGAGAAERSKGQPAVLGVRPDAMQVLPCAAGVLPPGMAAARVLALQQLGDRAHVVLRAAGHRLVACVPPTHALHEGCEAAVAINPAGVHLFEPGANGARIASLRRPDLS